MTRRYRCAVCRSSTVGMFIDHKRVCTQCLTPLDKRDRPMSQGQAQLLAALIDGCTLYRETDHEGPRVNPFQTYWLQPPDGWRSRYIDQEPWEDLRGGEHSTTVHPWEPYLMGRTVHSAAVDGLRSRGVLVQDTSYRRRDVMRLMIADGMTALAAQAVALLP